MRLAEKIANTHNMEIVNSSKYEDIVDGDVKEALCIELRKKLQSL